MLNLNCVICTELFGSTDDVHITPCGHLFHYTCLVEWLKRSKSCPQCRNKCSERNLTRVYFNLANLEISRIDLGSLQEQLDNANLELKIKTKEINKAEDHIKILKETQKKCMKTIAGLEQKMQKKEFVILSYTEQIKMLKSDAKIVDDLRKEIKNLKEQIRTMESLSTILTMNAPDAERLLKEENDPKLLSVWVTTLRRELSKSEHKKIEIRHELSEAQKELRKELAQNRKHKERISQLESDNYQMNEKLKKLESATSTTSYLNLSDKDNTVGLNHNIFSPTVKEESYIKVKEYVKSVENSFSPYLNVKASSIGLAPLLKRSKSTAKSLAKTKLSPIKSGNGLGVTMTSGAVCKTYSDLSEKYSIFKKPRLGFNPVEGVKPSNSNYAFNGFGGSDKIDPFSGDANAELTQEKTLKPITKNLNDRLKTGGFKDFKISK